MTPLLFHLLSRASWWADPSTRALTLYLLSACDGEGRLGISQRDLCRETGLSRWKLRTALLWMTSRQLLRQDAAQTKTYITILISNVYKAISDSSRQPAAHSAAQIKGSEEERKAEKVPTPLKEEKREEARENRNSYVAQARVRDLQKFGEDKKESPRSCLLAGEPTDIPLPAVNTAVSARVRHPSSPSADLRRQTAHPAKPAPSASTAKLDDEETCEGYLSVEDMEPANEVWLSQNEQDQAGDARQRENGQALWDDVRQLRARLAPSGETQSSENGQGRQNEVCQSQPSSARQDEVRLLQRTPEGSLAEGSGEAPGEREVTRQLTTAMEGVPEAGTASLAPVPSRCRSAAPIALADETLPAQSSEAALADMPHPAPRLQMAEEASAAQLSESAPACEPSASQSAQTTPSGHPSHPAAEESSAPMTLGMMETQLLQQAEAQETQLLQQAEAQETERTEQTEVARERTLVDELKASPLWVEGVRCRFHLSVAEIMALVDAFSLSNVCRGHRHRSLPDLKRHFCNWLRTADARPDGYCSLLTPSPDASCAPAGDVLQTALPDDPAALSPAPTDFYDASPEEVPGYASLRPYASPGNAIGAGDTNRHAAGHEAPLLRTMNDLTLDPLSSPSPGRASYGRPVAPASSGTASRTARSAPSATPFSSAPRRGTGHHYNDRFTQPYHFYRYEQDKQNSYRHSAPATVGSAAAEALRRRREVIDLCRKYAQGAAD